MSRIVNPREERFEDMSTNAKLNFLRMGIGELLRNQLLIMRAVGIEFKKGGDKGGGDK